MNSLSVFRISSQLPSAALAPKLGTGPESYAEAVRLLLAAGADPNAANAGGVTALMLAERGASDLAQGLFAGVEWPFALKLL